MNEKMPLQKYFNVATPVVLLAIMPALMLAKYVKTNAGIRGGIEALNVAELAQFFVSGSVTFSSFCLFVFVCDAPNA